MNSKGEGSGLMLVIILVVAILVGYLAVSQMSDLGSGSQETQQAQQNTVVAAQDAVDAINQKMSENRLEP